MASRGSDIPAGAINPGVRKSGFMARVFIGLGSNLDDPLKHIQSALDSLAKLPDSTLTKESSLYYSRPVGPQDQPDFVNAVVQLETGLAPEALLDHLQAIEARHGRERKKKWGPRTLDLDILLFDDDMICTRRLRVPHPEMHHRGFVLVPLNEIAPNACIIGHGSISTLLEEIDTSDLSRVTDT